MNTEYKKKLKEEASRYVERNVSDIKHTSPRKAASILKKLGAAPGECQESYFTLFRHLEEGYSVETQRQEILQYFASVSQEFPLLLMMTCPRMSRRA